MTARDVESGRFRMLGEEASFFAGVELFRLARSIVVIGLLGQKRELGSRIFPKSPEGVDDFAGGVGSTGAGESVAGMRAGAAEKKAADRRFVARPIENGPHGEKLIERKLAVKNVAASETVRCLEILGRDDLDAFDNPRQIRSVGRKGLVSPCRRVPCGANPNSLPSICTEQTARTRRERAYRQARAQDRESWES